MRPTVLITGATAGLGRYLTTLLAGMDWTVLAHGRDRRKLAELGASIPGDVQPLCADLASSAQVRTLARAVRRRTKRLDVLVNNAGIGFGAPSDQREVSPDGHELRIQVNYLAPVLLTRLLTPLLVSSAPSRVINIGSLGQQAIDQQDLEYEHDWNGTAAYRRSKLALAAFTFDLADELRGRVAVNCIHPASYMATTMVLDAGISPRTTIAEGAEAVMRLIVEPGAASVTGRFYDGLQRTEAHPEAYDLEFRRWLRQQTAVMLTDSD
ncbi:SDR family NAD(P)-dependent oxidoreductase [Nakamurella deserti]|uniref:SDR family NAD(P)-dependent oxidoreductase n=1 Tax=Nakamurella deserti TaxID=2164074 RepID=UPI000DBE94F4|nr:SDR family NAD(P)-dependent oxidoreductase [Nakamurella deserti]